MTQNGGHLESDPTEERAQGARIYQTSRRFSPELVGFVCNHLCSLRSYANFLTVILTLTEDLTSNWPMTHRDILHTMADRVVIPGPVHTQGSPKNLLKVQILRAPTPSCLLIQNFCGQAQESALYQSPQGTLAAI